MMAAQVLILMGSDSDLATMGECCKELERFGIGFEIHVSSAHRTPEKTEKLVKEAESRGIKVLVCAAGGAAHLAGVAAAQTT
jgi:5-(carboxyamino)imidazole ribonucleotide mutase